MGSRRNSAVGSKRRLTPQQYELEKLQREAREGAQKHRADGGFSKPNSPGVMAPPAPVMVNELALAPHMPAMLSDLSVDMPGAPRRAHLSTCHGALLLGGVEHFVSTAGQRVCPDCQSMCRDGGSGGRGKLLVERQRVRLLMSPVCASPSSAAHAPRRRAPLHAHARTSPARVITGRAPIRRRAARRPDAAPSPRVPPPLPPRSACGARPGTSTRGGRRCPGSTRTRGASRSRARRAAPRSSSSNRPNRRARAACLAPPPKPRPRPLCLLQHTRPPPRAPATLLAPLGVDSARRSPVRAMAPPTGRAHVAPAPCLAPPPLVRCARRCCSTAS